MRRIANSVYTILLSVALFTSTRLQADQNNNPDWDWRQGDYPEHPYPGSLFRMYVENGLGQTVAVPRNSPWGQGNAWVGLDDNKKEDGWVLVSRDFGAPTRPIFSSDQRGSPYFILYNKYKALLRFFVVVRANQDYTSGSIVLQLNSRTAMKSATLTHLQPRSWALDKPERTRENVGSALTVPLSDNWAWADFPMAYDPTVIANNEGVWLDFQILGTTESDLTMDGTATGIGGTKENVRDFMTGSSVGPTTVSKDVKRDLGQTFTAAKDKIGGTLGNYASVKELLDDMYKKIPNMDSRNPLGYISNNLKIQIGNLKDSWIPQALPVMGALVGLFDFFFGGGNTASSTLAPTFFGYNLSFSGSIRTEYVLPNPKRIQVPKSKLNPEIPVLGSFVPILYNEHVGVINLLRTPVLQYKTYFQSFPGGEPSRTYWDFRVKDNLQVVVNPSSGLIVDSIVSWIVMDPSPNVNLLDPTNDKDLALLATWVQDPTKQMQIEASLDGNFAFSSPHVPASVMKYQVIRGPDGRFIRPGVYQTGFSPDMTIKVKAVLHRADNPNAIPIVVVATYEPDFEDHGTGNWEAPPSILSFNKTLSFEFDNPEQVVDFAWQGVPSEISVPTQLWKNGRNYKFAGWFNGVHDNPRTITISTPTGITALYKSQLASTSIGSTSPTSQRKLLFHYTTGYHLAYSSNGDVWYTKSSDGVNWMAEKLVSRGSGTASNPSIAAVRYSENDTTYIVWVDTAVVGGQTKHTVFFRKLSLVTGELSSIQRVEFGGAQYWARPDAAPVAVRIGAMPNWPDVSIAFEAENAGIIVTHRYYYGSNGIVWWANQIPTTASTARRPSMTFSYDYSDSYPYTENISLTYDNGSHVFLSASGAVWSTPPSFGTPEQVSTSQFHNNRSAVLAVDPGGRKYITWIGDDWPSWGMPYTLVRNRYRTGAWSYQQYFIDDLGNPENLTTTICAHDFIPGATLFWCDQDVLLNMVSWDDGYSWFANSYSLQGTPYFFPNLAEEADPSAIPSVLTRNASAPHQVKFELRNNWPDQPMGMAKGTEGGITDSILSSVRHYRRLDLVDTSTGGTLAALFGNVKLFSRNGTLLQRLGHPRAANAAALLRSQAFAASPSAVLNADVGLHTINWNVPVTISINLLDSISGQVLMTLFSRRVREGEDMNLRENVSRSIPASLTGRPVYLALEVDGHEHEGIQTELSSALAIGTGGPLFKQTGDELAGGVGIPFEYALHQNYPNPFNPTTRIAYDLPEDGQVSLDIFDILGRKVATLVDANREAGYHTAIWDAAQYSSAVYFARLVVHDQTGNVKYSQTSKLMLIK